MKPDRLLERTIPAANVEEMKEGGDGKKGKVYVPLSPFILAQGAAATIRGLSVTNECELKPMMATARRRHNEMEYQRLANLVSQNEETIGSLFKKYPHAKEILTHWAEADESKDSVLEDNELASLGK